jgi:REP element-mobilizing transposase RayT
LCGKDPISGKDYGYRKKWIEELTMELAQYFGIEIISASIMANHIHHVLRSRPDLVKQWTDEEVARRWLYLYPKRRDKNDKPCEPSQEEIDEITGNRPRLKKLRKRLSHISWFMGRLKETIARRCNQDEDVDGRFWAGRYKCTRLDDESAVLACSVYVDLNPVRAKIVSKPEDARYTAFWHRIRARQSRLKMKRSRGKGRASRSTSTLDPDADRWLAPIYARSLPRGEHYGQRGHRASDDAGIGITLDQYIELVDWTGRQLRRDRRGAIPADLRPILERLEIDVDQWLETISTFGRWTRRVVGTAANMMRAAQQAGRQWYQGIRRCREIFTSSIESGD